MNREDIIKMAREAGFMVVSEGEAEIGDWYECFTDELERFAQLVAAAEREACAKVCNGVYYQHIGPIYGEVRYGIATCAAAIRARKDLK